MTGLVQASTEAQFPDIRPFLWQVQTPSALGTELTSKWIERNLLMRMFMERQINRNSYI